MENKEKLCGMLGLCTKAGKLIAGTEAVKEAIGRRKIKLVLVAKDTAERTKKTIFETCKQNKIPAYLVISQDELSQSIGKTNKAIIGIADENFAKAIEKILVGVKDFE